MPTPTADRADRDAARTRLDSNVVVVAGAGTGKTTLLTDRILFNLLGRQSPLPITALVGFLIGVVLAYLMSKQLHQYGADSFIVNILGMSLIRELGPVLAAILVAGRSGSAMTAGISGSPRPLGRAGGWRCGRIRASSPRPRRRRTLPATAPRASRR